MVGMTSGGAAYIRPRVSIIASIVFVLFLSLSTLQNASLWLNSSKTPVSAVTKQTSKTIINRNKTSSLGLHVCTCLGNKDEANLPRNYNPKRLRWLHFPKTGTSFISTLWSYSCSTHDRYIDLNINSQICVGKRAFSMYDYALMRRYPWEMYGAPNLIPDDYSASSPTNRKDVPLGLVGDTRHVPLSPNLRDKQFLQSDRYKKLIKTKQLRSHGSEMFTHNMTVVAFFRQPEERIISAYKDGFHANGFGTFDKQNCLRKVKEATMHGQCIIDNHTYTNPIQCFANYPGIAGCMSRMLTGQTCADSVFNEAGVENVKEAVDIVLNHLEFVGLTEDWNESICQFHRLFSGRSDSVSGQRVWDQPLQGEFANVHKSKKASIGVEELDGFKDVADTFVYEAAQMKFDQIVGNERCYKFMSWDEIEGYIDSNDYTKTQFIDVDKNGNLCHRLTCVDLEKQCGEWDDGCGSTVICGMCDSTRTGLPPTWRVQCVEGKCVDYCPSWEEKGLWFLSDDSPTIMKQVAKSIESRGQKYLSPVEAFEICHIACHGHGESGNTNTGGAEAFIDANLCQCGNPTEALKDIMPSDFTLVHDMLTTCSESKVRKSLIALFQKDTQPICCPSVDEGTLLRGKQWRRLYSVGGPNLEGSYFAHIYMGCGSLDECEDVAREKKADLAVFDIFNSYCHLAKNAFELDSVFTVTKDNTNRFILDLRNGPSYESYHHSAEKKEMVKTTTLQRDNNTSIASQTCGSEIGDDVVVFHPGKAGGGSLDTILQKSYKLKLKWSHPRPNPLYKEQLQNGPLRTLIINVRDPVDRFVSAFNWRRAVLCHPNDERIRVDGRNGMKATNLPEKFCQNENVEEERILRETYQSNPNVMAEALCRDSQLHSQAEKDLHKIGHTTTLSQWLDFLVDPQSVENFSADGIKELLVLPVEKRSGANESHLDEYIEGLDYHLRCGANVGKEMIQLAREKKVKRGERNEPKGSQKHQDQSYVHSSVKFHNSTTPALTKLGECCLARHFIDDYRLIQTMLGRNFLLDPLHGPHPVIQKACSWGDEQQQQSCRGDLTSMLMRRVKYLDESKGSCSAIVSTR